MSQSPKREADPLGKVLAFPSLSVDPCIVLLRQSTSVILSYIVSQSQMGIDLRRSVICLWEGTIAFVEVRKSVYRPSVWGFLRP